MERGTGKTTDQIREAPKGAIFVWCNDYTGYVRDIAKSLGRDDLKIIGLSQAKNGEYFLGRSNPIVYDHCCGLVQTRYARGSLSRYARHSLSRSSL